MDTFRLSNGVEMPLLGYGVFQVSPDVLPGQTAAMASTTCLLEDSRGLVWHGSTSGCCVVDWKQTRNFHYNNYYDNSRI